MLKEVYIIDDDETSLVVFKELFRNDEDYKFISVKSEQIDVALNNIPSLIIINEDAIQRDVVELCDQIRKNEDNTITPVIVVSSNRDKQHRLQILKESVEYYIRKPVDEEYLYHTIKNLGRLLSINRTISPLTGLPGNVQIHAELKKRLTKREEFAVLYIDLDNFKAYNDVYGFLKGDQIIQFTADTILGGIHTLFSEGTFVGHIGGDDFIAITPYENIEDLCQTMIATFDKGVKRFFTEADQEKGYIEVENRKGVIEQFQLTSVSIGVVVAERGRFANILEIGEVSTQVKHLAKSISGSSYAIDRRKTHLEDE
jgi:diguanylate cyclase (GGDEF)-like protein